MFENICCTLKTSLDFLKLHIKLKMLLLFQPTPQRIRPEHAQTLEKYAWQTMDDNSASKL